MTKTSYTREEFRLIATALEREKKKRAEFDKLKSLLLALKQKQDRALIDLQEKEHLTAAVRQQALFQADLEEENQLFSQQITTLKQSLHQIQQKQADELLLQRKLSEVEELTNNLDRELRETQEQNQLLEKRVDQTVAESQSEVARLLQEKEARIAELQNDEGRLKQAKERLDEELNHRKLAYQQLQEHLVEVEELKSSLDKELRNTREQNQRLEKRVAQMVTEAQGEVARLLQEKEACIAELQNDEGRLKQAKQRVDEELNHRKLAHQQLQGHLVEIEELKNSLDRELRETQEQNQRLEKRLSESQGEAARLLQEKEARIADLQNDEGRLKQTKERLDEELNHRKLAYQQLQGHLADVEELKNNLDRELCETQEQNQRLEIRLSESQGEAAREQLMIEKLVRLIQEKEARIAELQSYEGQLKQASELKNLLEQTLEQEQLERAKLVAAKNESERSLEESRKHAQQLERVIQFLRERSEEAQLELQQLRQDFQSLQTNFDRCDEQLRAARSETATVEQLLQREKQAHQEAQEELQALQGQFAGLKSQIQTLQGEQSENRQELIQKQLQNEALTSAKTALENQLHAQAKRHEAFELEVARIKQTLMRALRESQELEAHYQVVVEEKVAQYGKWRQAQNQLDKEREERALLQDKLATASNLHQQLREQLQNWQQQYEQAKSEASTHLAAEVAKNEQHADLLRKRDEAILDLQRQVGLLRHEGEKVRDELAETRGILVENDQDKQVVQQHLARKVKETTELEAHCEVKQREIEELHRIQQADKVKIAELQANRDLYEQQQRRLEERLQEAIKAYEAQQAKWEDKYLALYEKYQMNESRNKELEKLEERYKQLQGLLTNVGNFLEAPAKPMPTLAAVKEEPAPKPYSNLFDRPTASRSKQNLLD